MKTIFSLFKEYGHADKAIDELLNQGFTEDEMNLIVQETTAETHLDVNMEKVKVQVTDEVGRQTVHGLEKLIGREKPITITGLGKAYAAGDLATTLAKTASMPGAVDGGFKAALVDFGVSADTAQSYGSAVGGGGLLFWIRAEDHQSSQIANTLRQHHGEMVDHYPK
jgi:hypothetical protein